MNFAPIATAEELAADTAATVARNNALAKALFGQYGYTEFALLPIKTQHAIETITSCQWDIEDTFAAEGGVVGPGSTFGARLKAARLARGITKAAAARAVGIHQGGYQMRESAANCNLDTAIKLSVALNVSVDYLAGRSEGLGVASPDAGTQGAEGCGARLKAARVAKGMTRATAGRMAGLSEQGLRRLETSGKCRLSSAAMLADALGVSLDYLAGAEELDQQRPELEAA